jgi:hypothetical protein
MRRSWIGAACALLTVLALATPAAAAVPAPRAALGSLVHQTASLPAGSASRALQRRLLATAKLARRQARRAPCRSVRALARYRRILGRIHVRSSRHASRRARRRAAAVAALGPASLRASRALLKSRRTRRCGGGVSASKLKHPTAVVRDSSTNGLTVTVRLPEVNFVPRTGGGRAWTQLTLADTDSPQKPGTPGIPIVSSQFAAPDGATVEVDPGSVKSYTVDGVDVYPAQPESVDAASATTTPPNFAKPPFATKPFTFDPKAYANSDPLPAADGGLLGHVRDLAVGDLQVPAVQFDPKRHRARVIESVDVKITFGGKNAGSFDDELGAPWERAARSGLADLLNGDLVLRHLGPPIRYLPCGEQLLIITNHDTRTAADTLAGARSGAGWMTRVVEVGAGAGQIGTTPDAIQKFIRGQLTALKCVHPSYIAIIGDDDLVATWTSTPGSIPSDLPYALRDDADELPDVAIGRIIGNDQAAVQTAVDKIVGYEARAPSTGDFLTHATVAAQFQDDEADGMENRTFIQFAETVRNGLVRRGVTVDRVYHDSPTTTPTRFNDGTDLPRSLLKPTFPWDGTGADVTADWNAGRFLIIHRDHGWSDGWGTPSFTTSDVDALTNGSLLPVVMSVNCSSGAYDYDETSFAGNALVKAGGGAVGVFGDTRDSPSWHNSQLALGFVDALLPSVLPSEGPATAQRMGDALINGKLRLAGLSSPTSDGNTRNELYLWHYFGDPTMQLWGGGHAPIVFDPSRFAALLAFEITKPGPGPDPPPWEVRVTLPPELNGQPISLLHDGQVIGEALVEDGHAVIAPLFGDGSVKPGSLQVAIEGDGAQPVSAPVDTSATRTTLTQQCPETGTTDQPLTVRGALGGAPAGSTVDVTFQAPSGRVAGRTVVQHVATQADGSWQASVTPTANEPGTWTVSSAYAGDAAHQGSSAGPCQVLVEPPLIP